MDARARYFRPEDTPQTQLIDGPARCVALDDPVPSDSIFAEVSPHFRTSPPHHVESEVRRALVARDDLHFSSLVVRRLHDGVCLEGMLEVGNDAPDVDELVREVAGVERVINRLIVHSDLALPRKLR